MNTEQVEARVQKEKHSRFEKHYAFQAKIEEMIKQRDQLEAEIERYFKAQREQYDIATGRIQAWQEMLNEQPAFDEEGVSV